MGRKVIKFNLNGDVKFSKPFQTEDNLFSIREKIKERFFCSFQFIDLENNPVDCKDENDFTAEDILDGQIIKLKSTEDANSNSNKTQLNILVNGQKICSKSLEKEMHLDKCREMINKEIKGNFNFLDKYGNKVDEEDEKEFIIEDILNNGEIKLKQDTIDSPPPTPMTTLKEEVPAKNEEIPSKMPIDFSKYETLEKEDNLTIYKYSNKERQSKQKLVYQYFYDEFNNNDYDNAYVVLFCGKIGDGKSTDINAFINTIKGVKLEDNNKFNLITEPKKAKEQAESQTYGVHLYYLKDYNNKPVILIDSQGYGDTRDLEYDKMIDDAFRYVFSNIIKHIDIICLAFKTNRLDFNTSETSLFSEDITEKFNILETFASKETIKNGPAFIDSIQTDSDFLNIQKRGMDEKWWFTFDSKCLLSNEEDRLTKYSFSQLNELCDKKVKKLRLQSIKKCAEILENRIQLKFQINNLSDNFQNLLKEQANLQEKEKNIIETQKQIEEMHHKNQEEKDRIEREYQKYLEELDRKKNDKTSLEKQINDLNDHKKVLEEEQKKNIKEEYEIKEKIKNTSSQITYIIKLQNISQKIEYIAMNNNHLKTQDEYIDFLKPPPRRYSQLRILKDKMDQIGMNDE